MANEITAQPPFEPPQHLKKAHLWSQRKIPESYSDGDQRHWPGAPKYRPSSDEYYLCVLGQKWAEHDKIAQPGVQYYLDKLPNGYAMFETDQPGGPQVYRRLFGHPSGRFYDSALRFEPHFQWLMSGMEGDCTCVLDAKTSTAHVVPRQPRATREVIDRSILHGRKYPRDLADNSDDNASSRGSSTAAGIAGNRTQRHARQTGTFRAVDEEGTDDIYKECIKKLENARGDRRGVEIDLKEESSIDWQADRQSLPQYLTRIEQQHCFIPRIGELVLWCPTFLDDHYLMLDHKTSEYKFYSFEQKCFHGFPAWRGGVIAAVPSASIKNGPIDFPDILDTPKKKTAFNTAGFRVETMSDPNDDYNKGMSKQYKYVPLRSIRPLAQWQSILHGIPRERLHPSIEFALTCMTSLSLLEKWRFNGDWPNARIFSKALYLGSELITVGDTIRLIPSTSENDIRPDVLIVESIRYNLLDIQTEHAMPDNPGLSSSSFITFVGSAYTNDKDKYLRSQPSADISQDSRSPLKSSAVKTLFRPVGVEGYGKWYPWHSARQRYEVSHEQVLGRLCEADAVRLWTGAIQSPSDDAAESRPTLSFDWHSVVAARRYATEADARLEEPQSKSTINWFFADTRAEALAIATLNGIDIGKYHDIRTPSTLNQWRTQVKIADGQPVTLEVEDEYIKDLTQLQLYTGARRGRPPGSKVVDGKLVLPGEHIDNITDNDATEDKRKPSSQMAGAALATDNDDSFDECDSDEIEVYDISKEEDGQDTIRIIPPPAPPKSKAAIMASIEALEDDVFNNDVSDDEMWPVPRGGTEESEGGDYRE